jgi:ABC-type uncharacterized transport system ATPase subunit
VKSGIPSVEMRGITKRFPGVLANDDVDFEARSGEVHALLGENGAGKSTLMNILSGFYRPDEGEILLEGRRTVLRSPRDAINLGIGMVHQHFMLVDVQTVAENVELGQAKPRFLLNLNETERRIEELSEGYGLQVAPGARIWQLSVGEQQRVEILKMLYRGTRILILDEPTAVLTPQEVERLFATLRRMVEEGHTVILITHKLEEVMAIARRVTVLRKGKVVATVAASETDKRGLARMMVGREILFQVTRKAAAPGKEVLRAEDVCALSDKGLPALRDVSFSIRGGEILGIAGVAGNGQRELAEVITGLRRSTSGSICVGSKATTNCSPWRVIQQKVSHIPEDRLGVGLVPDLPVSDNVILKGYREPPLARGPFLNGSSITDFAESLIAAFDIAAPGPQVPVRLLSGGNLQKTILAREMSAEPELLVAVHPTRGLDVGATESVRNMLLARREKGAAILLISEDLDEIVALSDRIAVLYEGQIMGIMDGAEARIEDIGLMMAGIVPSAEENAVPTSTGETAK